MQGKGEYTYQIKMFMKAHLFKIKMNGLGKLILQNGDAYQGELPTIEPVEMERGSLILVTLQRQFMNNLEAR